MLDNNRISLKGVTKTGNTYAESSAYTYTDVPCYLVKEDYKEVAVYDIDNMHKTFFCQIDRYLPLVGDGWIVDDKNGNRYYVDGFTKFEEDNYTELTLILRSTWQDTK